MNKNEKAILDTIKYLIHRALEHIDPGRLSITFYIALSSKNFLQIKKYLLVRNYGYYYSFDGHCYHIRAKESNIVRNDLIFFAGYYSEIITDDERLIKHIIT